jgi:transposase-like protein
MGKSYVPTPTLPPALVKRYRVIVEVMSGELTVSEGARRLGLSRNHFQTLMHRSQHGLLEALQGKPAGRPPVPESEKRLREQTAQLRQENQRLRDRVEATDRLLGVASGLLKGRMERRTRPSKPHSPEDE